MPFAPDRTEYTKSQPLPGMPDRIPPAQAAAAIRTLGIDPTDVCRLVMDSSGQCVHITTYDRDESGHRYLDPATGEPAVTVTTIPLEF